MRDWISVEDRLPEDGDYVLLHRNGERYVPHAIGYVFFRPDVDNPCWTINGVVDLIKNEQPTHWMPLPEPPEAEQ